MPTAASSWCSLRSLLPVWGLPAIVVICCGIANAASISGTVLGGQRPIVSSTVSVFQVGRGGYGTSATKLKSVISNSKGKFSLAVPVCVPANAIVYVTAQGGMAAGVIGAKNNPALFTVATLGPCNALPPSIVIDEVTTVATAYALAQFTGAISPHPVSAPGTNTIGLGNAAANANNLANVTNGQVPKAPPVAIIPVAKISTLADVLAYCVGSNGSTGSTSRCGKLLAAATAPGHTAPTETLGALLTIARNPANDVKALFALAAGGPYTPTLSAAPADWTMVADFAGGGLGGPDPAKTGSTGCATATDRGIAIDARGNVWVSAVGTVCLTCSAGLSEFNPAGRPISPARGFSNTVYGTGGGGLAIDQSGSIWVPNFGNLPDGTIHPSVVKAPSSNPACSSTGIKCQVFTDVNEPVDAAIDSKANAWVDDTTAGVTGEPDEGAVIKLPAGKTLSAPGLNRPTAIATDGADNVWISDGGCTNAGSCSPFATPNILKLNSAGKLVSPPGGYTHPDIVTPAAIAIDAHGNVWDADDGHCIGPTCSGYLTELDPMGKVISSHHGEGMSAPVNIAIDGADNVWVTDNSSNCNGGFGQVEEFSAAGAPLLPCGVSDANIVSPEGGIAIDSSGNVWVADDGSCSVVEIIGAATPVKTPLFAPPTKP